MTIVNGTISVDKVIAKHFVKHEAQYVIDGSILLLVVLPVLPESQLSYKKGNRRYCWSSHSHEKKMKEMHQKYENDRKCWNERKEVYEDLLDKVDRKRPVKSV